MLGKETLTPFKNTENSLHKVDIQGDPKTSEMAVNSRKRKCGVTGTYDSSLKRACNEDSKFPSNLQDEFRQNEAPNIYQTKQYIPHHLIGLMYRLDLSVLCWLKKVEYEHKYPSLSLAFGSSETDKFNNIILCYKEKSMHIQIENVDKYYIDNCISYAKLFTREKEKRSFFINDYFESFVKHLIYKLDCSLNQIEYLIIYTNAGLGLTEQKKFKKGRSRSFYPFMFKSIDMGKHDILKDFLFTNDNEKGRVFYQLLQDETTRGELLKRLECSTAMQKIIKERQLYETEIKEAFLDKLIFAVNQPSREDLNSFIKINKSSSVEDDYITLQGNLLRDLTGADIHKNIVNYVTGIIYEFHLLVLFLHDMFLHKNMFSINFVGKSQDTSSGIAINYNGRTSYIKAHNADSNIGYSQLFPSRREDDTFSINKYFALFAESLKNYVRYFIVYTNANLDLTEEKEFKKGRSKGFYPFKFDSINIQKKRYKILRDCSCINENGLYQFSQEETARLLSLLKLPPSLQKEKGAGRLSDENEKEIKENFFAKLILAVNQPNKDKLNSIIRNQSNSVPYNYEKLCEIALRWSESHELGPITEEIMKKLSGDIKHNRSSYQNIQNKNVDEEIKFAKSVVGREGTPTFDQFLAFLIKGEGKKYLEVLKRNGIRLASVSSVLNKAGINAANAFKQLCDLWFDVKGNKTQYLKTLEKEEVSLANMTSILNGAGSNAALAFVELYDLWFAKQGNKSQYLKTLEKEGVNLARMSSILSGTGANAAKAFKELYGLWFDKQGYKTCYLKTLENEGVSLGNVSSVLNGAGSNAAKAFVELYDLWFDEEGSKKLYLITLEAEGVNLARMSSILSGAGVKASKAFEELYYLWFDVNGNKKQSLKTLENEGVCLANMSSILSRTAANAAKAFNDLYYLWFDVTGNKTQYLKTLEQEGINLSNISSILHGAAANAPKAFKDLHNLWFDVKGNKKAHLKHFINDKNEENRFTIHNLSSILNGVGANVKDAFEQLHSVCFNNKGTRTRLLDDFYRAGFRPNNLTSMLRGAGANAKAAIESLHSVCFNKKGNRSRLLDDFYNAGFRPSNLSTILSGAGANAKEAIEKLHSVCFNNEGKRTRLLDDFHKAGFRPSNLSNMLIGAGANAKEAFEKLHSACFNNEGKRSKCLDDFCEAGFRISNLSSMLNGAGAHSFEKLHSICFNNNGTRTRFLDDFHKAGFRPSNLSSILNGAGANAKDAFERFHSICFKNKGTTSRLLDDFYKAGFKPSNLSCLLCGSGANAASILKRLHNVCFDDDRKRTKRLDDFYKSGFRPADLCKILSAAADSLKEFHYFCFIGETKEYLRHFLNVKEGFTRSNLSDILHGARGNICHVLKDFHDVCFDEAGNKTQLLEDFYNAGFRSDDLSNILSMAGSNVTSILRNFHELCFKYLDNFLSEEELFTPKDLSRILRGVGMNICVIFEKLYDLCFDKSGNRTDYLDGLIKTRPSNKVLIELHERVRKCPSTFLNNIPLQQQDISIVEDTEMVYDSQEEHMDLDRIDSKDHMGSCSTSG